MTKTIIITGATKGIGRHIALYFADKENFNLALVARNIKELDAFSVYLKKEFPELHFMTYAADIANQSEVKTMFNVFKQEFSQLDVLINNAAIAGPIGPITDTDMVEYKKTLDVNVYGTLHCMIEAIKCMKLRTCGKIINICGAGVGWDATSIEKSAYVVSKYALYGLNESLSRELKPFNIDMNCISPGSYDTQLRDKLVKNDRDNTKIQSFEHFNETLGNLIGFLVSHASDGISGKMFSAMYDSPSKILDNFKSIKDSSDYTVRKIDNVNYVRK